MINTLENGGLNLTDFETYKSTKIVLDSASFRCKGRSLDILSQI